MKKTFSDDVKQAVLFAYTGYCAHKGCVKKATSVHHRVPKTIYNTKKYPNFIHSVLNAIPLCNFHHEHRSEWNTSDTLCELYEKFLQELRDDVSF